jgi:hypothetical protein
MGQPVIGHHQLEPKVFQRPTFTFVAVTKRYRVDLSGIVEQFYLFYFAETVLFALFLKFCLEHWLTGKCLCC